MSEGITSRRCEKAPNQGTSGPAWKMPGLPLRGANVRELNSQMCRRGASAMRCQSMSKSPVVSWVCNVACSTVAQRRCMPEAALSLHALRRVGGRSTPTIWTPIWVSPGSGGEAGAWGERGAPRLLALYKCNTGLHPYRASSLLVMHSYTLVLFSTPPVETERHAEGPVRLRAWSGVVWSTTVPLVCQCNASLIPR